MDPGLQRGAPGEELLKGLQDANKQFQGKQLEKLQEMYKQGGMGGGLGAGGFY
jgi:hypothetical protein